MFIAEIWTQILNYLVPVFSFPSSKFQAPLFELVFQQKRSQYNKLVFLIFSPVLQSLYYTKPELIEEAKESGVIILDKEDYFHVLDIPSLTHQYDSLWNSIMENFYTCFQICGINKQLYTSLRHQQNTFWKYCFSVMKHTLSSSHFSTKTEEEDFYLLARRELYNWEHAQLKHSFKMQLAQAADDFSKLTQEGTDSAQTILEHLPSYLDWNTQIQNLIYSHGYSKKKIYNSYLEVLLETQWIYSVSPIALRIFLHHCMTEDILIIESIFQTLWNGSYVKLRFHQSDFFFECLEWINNVKPANWKQTLHLFDSESCIGELIEHRDGDALLAVLKLLRKFSNEEHNANYFNNDYLLRFLDKYRIHFSIQNSKTVTKLLQVVELLLQTISSCKEEIPQLLHKFWKLEDTRTKVPTIQVVENQIEMTRLLMDHFQFPVTKRDPFTGDTVLHTIIKSDAHFVPFYKYFEKSKTKPEIHWQLEWKQCLHVKNQKGLTPLQNYAEYVWQLQPRVKAQRFVNVQKMTDDNYIRFIKLVMERAKQIQKWCLVEPIVKWEHLLDEWATQSTIFEGKYEHWRQILLKKCCELLQQPEVAEY